MRVALIAGSTGLIGKHLLQRLLESGQYDVVKAIVRHDPGIQHEKLKLLFLDFDHLGNYEEELTADDVFCCLGTTMAKARSKPAFYKVDYTYPVELAKQTQMLGAKKFLIVSALGANKSSSFYYNQVKGQVEETITSIPFEAIHIFRPSLLLGNRSEERRGEDAAKLFYKIFHFLIPSKYKGIEAEKVARAMAFFASEDKPGTFIHESHALQGF